MLNDEFYANYDEIKKEFPGRRILDIKQMADYLGISPRSLKNTFGISTKLTVESFAVRLSKMGVKNR